MNALLIDGLNLVRRIYAAVPGDEGSDKHRDNVLHSIQRSVKRAIDHLHPSHALCAFDVAGQTWRHELLAEYKANRPAMPAPLTALLPRIESTLLEFGIKSLHVLGYEADDILASIAVKISEHGGNAIILSTDKSMLSLLRAGIQVRNHFDECDLGIDYTYKRFGVKPKQIPTYLALVGDSSQNVPGVKSVGAKTAAKLINEHDTLEAILTAARGDMDNRVGKALIENEADARLSLQLMSLHLDVHVGVNLNECRLY